MEVWKDIKGYEGLYQISTLFRVKRFYLKNKKTKILKPHITSSGYVSVSLSKKSKLKKILVHRIFMETFFPLENMMDLDVNHINGVKTDNFIQNLEWATRSENLVHSILNNLKKTKLKKEDIPLIRNMLKNYKHKEIAEKFGVSKHTINKIASNQSWKFV